MEIIQVNNLYKTYHNHDVLAGVNLTLEKGQIYGLIGKNGVGKTTLMRILTGLAFKTSGNFSLFGVSAEGDMEMQRRRIGAVVETPVFYPFFSARENLEYYRIQRGVVERDCIDRVLEEVGLSDTGKKPYKSFSLGMKQRLGLALALMGSPDLLILDEPTNGLDPQGIAELRHVLKRLNIEKDITMLISSHNLNELSTMATCYGFMHKGTMLEEIGAKELEEKCRIYIEVKVSDSKRLARLLETQLSCTGYEVLPKDIVRIYEYYEDPSVISDLIMENGMKLLQLEVKSADLEQYFLELIGGKTV